MQHYVHTAMCTHTMCTLLCAHMHTMCTHTMMPYYYVHTRTLCAHTLWCHTTMCTPTFHTWNAGLQKVSTLLHVEYGSVTKQGCYRTAWEAGPKPQTQIHHHPPCYYVKAFSSRSSNTKLWRFYKWPLFYWDHCMNFTQRAPGQHFTVSALDEQQCPPPQAHSGQKCLWNLHTGRWEGAWDNVLRWCIKFREPTPAFMLCNSHKYRVSRDLRLCDALGTKCVLHTVLHPRKFISLLTKSVRQERHLPLPNAFLLVRTNVLFCFAINWLTIISSLRNCLLINDFSCFSFKTLLKIQKIVLIKV